MRIRILGSAVDSSGLQFAASYLINDTIAIDAGAIGFMSVEKQRRLKHVVISHAHLDHIASLPIFIDNVYEPGPECVDVYGSADVIDCLQTHFFNERVWPDMLRLSREESPFLTYYELHDRQTVEIDGTRVTPVALDHIIPTFGFLVDDGESAVGLISDTCPTTEIWNVLNQCDHLKAVFLEAAFPNSMEWLAKKSRHLTPSQFATEYAKLKRPVPVIAVHIKAAFYEEVTRELSALSMPSLTIGKPDHDYEY